MLDYLLKEKIVEQKPQYAFALGILFSTIGMIMAVLIFKESPSFPAVFLTTLAAAPIAMRIIKKNEKSTDLYERYRSVIEVYAYLFFGMAVSFAIWFAILPAGFVSILFKEQLLKFSVGYFTFERAELLAIVLNNMGLMLFFFLLSLFYGTGAMFLLAWNASILGTMWGNTIRGALTILTSGQAIVNTIMAFPYLFPEVAAYFFAAVAGGILSINISKKAKFDRMFSESILLLLTAAGLIIVSGVIETFILGL